MRMLISVSCLVAIFSMNVSADDVISEQQIMLYYQIPLSASKANDSRHQFGLRLDQVTHAPGEDVHISALGNKTASMDFRMGYAGIQSVKIRGVEYGPYLIARAAEGDATPASTEPAEALPAATESPDAEAASAESATTETAEAPKAEDGVILKTLKNLPFGVYLGAAIGAVLLIGVDN